MAAKIGILGESTVVTNSVYTTIYTVPADKAARVRIQFALEGAGTHNIAVLVGSPGTERTMAAVTEVNYHDMWTGSTRESTPDPTLSMMYSVAGIQNILGGLANLDGTDNANNIVFPLPVDYFLSTGDTVQFRIAGSDPDDLLIQVQGVEDDA